MALRAFQDLRFTPELFVRMLPSDVDGSIEEEEKSLSGAFPMLSFSNLPQVCEPDEVQMYDVVPTTKTRPSQPYLN
eukprot:11534085-Prorocentrum_lima.AAC.1